MLAMENPEIVDLLREIRDLQRLHVANYKDALINQQESIALQQKATRFQRRALLALVAVVILFLAYAYLVPSNH